MAHSLSLFVCILLSLFPFFIAGGKPPLATPPPPPYVDVLKCFKSIEKCETNPQFTKCLKENNCPRGSHYGTHPKHDEMLMDTPCKVAYIQCEDKLNECLFVMGQPGCNLHVIHSLPNSNPPTGTHVPVHSEKPTPAHPALHPPSSLANPPPYSPYHPPTSVSHPPPTAHPSPSPSPVPHPKQKQNYECDAALAQCKETSTYVSCMHDAGCPHARGKKPVPCPEAEAACAEVVDTCMKFFGPAGCDQAK